MRLKFCTLLVLCLGLVSPAFAGFEEGKAAYDAGDLDAAKQEWLPLAEAGDAEAQFWMGKLYHPSKKEFTDIDQAIYWYSLAAEQNYQDAQNGLILSYGQKKPASIYGLHMLKWLVVVKELYNDTNASDVLKIAKDELPLKMYNEGVEMGKEWLKNHSSNISN